MISIIFLTIFQVFAADLSTPRATMKTFLKAMVEIKKSGKEAPHLQTALQTLQYKDVKLGRKIAFDLIDTLDHIERVDYSKIPLNPKGTYWVYDKRRTPGEDASSVEIALERSSDGKWRFSKKTSQQIRAFRDLVKNQAYAQGVSPLPEWATKLEAMLPLWMSKRSLGLANWQWPALLIILFLSFLVDRLLKLILLRIALRKLKSIGSFEFDDHRQKSFVTPAGYLGLALTAYTLIPAIGLPTNALLIVIRALKIVIAIVGVWMAHQVVEIITLYFHTIAERTENKFDDILIPLLSKSAKVIVFAIGGVFVAHSFTLDVTNILAGLGIGGLAFALAAKDTLSNLFGSLMIVLDRPFHIGDVVQIDGSTEGTVVEVGFRSTRIRTFYDSLVTIPNNQLTNVSIDNFGRRRYRRLSTKLGVQYDTPPERVEAFCDAIRRLIAGHPKTRKDSFHVYFTGMGDSALEITLYCFWEVPDWSEELNQKHRLFMDILRIANDMGVSFAFPTQTLHLYQEQPSETHAKALNAEIDQATSKIKGVLERPFYTGPSRSSSDSLM